MFRVILLVVIALLRLDSLLLEFVVAVRGA